MTILEKYDYSKVAAKSILHEELSTNDPAYCLRIKHVMASDKQRCYIALCCFLFWIVRAMSDVRTQMHLTAFSEGAV